MKNLEQLLRAFTYVAWDAPACYYGKSVLPKGSQEFIACIIVTTQLASPTVQKAINPLFLLPSPQTQFLASPGSLLGLFAVSMVVRMGTSVYLSLSILEGLPRVGIRCHSSFLQPAIFKVPSYN